MNPVIHTLFDGVELECNRARNIALLKSIRAYARGRWGKKVEIRYVPPSQGKVYRMLLPVSEPFVTVINKEPRWVTVFFDTRENYERIMHGL